MEEKEIKNEKGNVQELAHVMDPFSNVAGTVSLTTTKYLIAWMNKIGEMLTGAPGALVKDMKKEVI